MKKVRLGILGLGNIGWAHANCVLAGRVPGLELMAAADTDAGRRSRLKSVRVFDSAEALVESGMIDALLICTPHPHHVDAGVLALKAGLHVLVEKPLSIQKADAQVLLAAHKDRKQVFGILFNQRTDPAYLKIRHLVLSGELGRIHRVAWTATEWFRPQAYYASSSWRATWAGEGGGMLLNQCPHHLDLLSWIFGQPSKVIARCNFGRYHDIEVEDDVMAMLEWSDGTVGTFVASTGEAPGRNRLEVACERGLLIFEGGNLVLHRNQTEVSSFSRETADIFGRPDCWRCEIPVGSDLGGQHQEILRNFTQAILEGVPLLAPASEGMPSLELANAMLLSAWTSEPVELPLDAANYAKQLKKRIASSRFTGESWVSSLQEIDMARSYTR